MPSNERGAVIREVQTLYSGGTAGGLSDRQLLDRCANRAGAVADAAFAILVERHGAMVWGVCQRVLPNPHDAADAFQATFLILLRRASAVRVDDSLGRWLYGVSRRVALRARTLAKRRSTREIQAQYPDLGQISPIDPEWVELLAALDEEIERLPAAYRTAIVLCDLDGLSHEEAARQIGCAVGTIGSRLVRGRQRLRVRLTRRGIGPAAGVLAATLTTEAARAAVPPWLIAATVITARSGAALSTASSAGYLASVVFLTEEVLRSMANIKLKWLVGAVVAGAISTGGVLVYAFTDDQKAAKPAAVDAPTQKEASKPEDGQTAALLEIIAARLKARELECREKEAELALEKAKLERLTRIAERHSLAVSAQEMEIQQVHLKSAEFYVQIATAEAQEVKICLDQARRIVASDHPEQLGSFLAQTGVGLRSSTSALEKKITRVERQLDRILELLESQARPPVAKGTEKGHP